jgi:hypothetical protein
MTLDRRFAVDAVHIRVLPDGRVSRKDAAAYLGREAKTLTHWASRGFGPKPIRIGSRSFYDIADLDAFIRASTEAA